jgi:aspartate aminotransferase-like enzyme
MQVPDQIRAAGDRPMFNHRSAQMDELLGKLQTDCRPLFGTSGDVIFLAASGTGAMESAIVNLTSPADEVIVMAGGTFAERWTEIGTSYGLRVHNVDVDWQYGSTVNDVARAMAAYPSANVVFLTWSESSTGVLIELDEIGKLVRLQNKFLVVDAVSGLAVSPLQMDQWQIDVVISGSQKGLMIPAGLGLVAISGRAWERARNSRSARYYWDWKKYKGPLPFTPALTLLFQLEASLEYVKTQGLARLFKRKADVAGSIRDLVKQSGFKIYAQRPGNGITAVVPDPGFDMAAFIRRLERDFGIQIAGGLGRLKDSTFRIGHVGFVGDEELDYFVQSFSAALKP